MEASLKLSFELISGHVFHKQCWASKERRSAIPFLSFPTFCSRNNICIKRIQKFEQLNHYDEHCKGSEDRYFGVGWVFSERIYPGFYLQEQRKGKKYRTCIKKKVLLVSQISYKSLHFLPRTSGIPNHGKKDPGNPSSSYSTHWITVAENLLIDLFLLNKHIWGRLYHSLRLKKRDADADDIFILDS